MAKSLQNLQSNWRRSCCSWLCCLFTKTEAVYVFGKLRGFFSFRNATAYYFLWTDFYGKPLQVPIFSQIPVKLNVASGSETGIANLVVHLLRKNLFTFLESWQEGWFKGGTAFDNLLQEFKIKKTLLVHILVKSLFYSTWQVKRYWESKLCCSFTNPEAPNFWKA